MDYKEKEEDTLGGEDDEGTSLESTLNLLDIILKELPDKITHYTTSCVVHAQVAWKYALVYPKLLKRFEGYPTNLYNNTELHEMHQTSLSLFERTLAKYKSYSIYEESRKQYIEVQHLIALVLLDSDKQEDAKLLCQSIHKTFANELGESNPLTLDILNSLPRIEGRLGNYSEEMTILERIIAIRTATTPDVQNDTHTLVFLYNQAACSVQMGKYDEALRIFKSTLELMGKHHPEDRKSINIMRHLIAITIKRHGNFAEALQMFKNVHAELVESLGESHAITLDCAREIGDCLLDLGECEEAMKVLTHAMELTNANKDDQVQFANMKYSIAKVLLKMKRYDETISEFRIVLGEQISIYGEAHPQVLRTREHLARALKSVGCTGEALEHYEFVYEIRLKTISAEHPGVIRVKEFMESMRKRKRENKKLANREWKKIRLNSAARF